MSNDIAFKHWRTQDGQIAANVRELRRDLTPSEQLFWQAIRNRAIDNVKFRRQHPFEQFILDFYAPEIRLAIEVDGKAHDDPERKRYDKWREDILNGFGIEVIRFTNDEVGLDLDSVIQRLRTVIAARRQR